MDGPGLRRLLRPDWEGEMIHASDSEEGEDDSDSESDSDSGRDKGDDAKEDDFQPKSRSPVAGTGVDMKMEAGEENTSGGEGGRDGGGEGGGEGRAGSYCSPRHRMPVN